MLAHLASGASFYVVTNGNDLTGDGSLGNPWQSVSNAVNSAGAGATIYVGPGHYNTDGVSFRPLHLNVSGQTIIASNGVYLKQVWFEAANVTLTNTTIGETHYGGFETDPVVWFKAGSGGSKVRGGKIYSTVGQNQYGIRFEGGNGIADGVEFTAFGPSGVCIETVSSTNQIINCYIHDNGSLESVFYIWGNYNLIAGNIISNNNELEKAGSHPDIFQSFFAASWGQVISNNFLINNSCQLGNLQAVDASTPGATYATNAGGWIFVNNVFINQGSKLDIDFRDMIWLNNTFYNCMNNSSEGHVMNFNSSIYGDGTNGVMKNNLFFLCGSDPTSTGMGWFAVSDGSSPPGFILNTMTISNNMVAGAGFAAKSPGSLYGTNWVNGGSPKFLYAPAYRIHKLNLTGTTSANATTNVYGAATSFTTELAVGDHITCGPFWDGAQAAVVKIINDTNLWTDGPIGTGTSTKYGGPQNMQRLQGYDPLPDLRVLAGSLAIDAGATLDNNPYDMRGTNRPVGARFDIGAYEGATPEVIPTNMIMHITFNNWGGGTNALDSTTNHCDAALFLNNWPVPAVGPDGGSAAYISSTNSAYFGVTNVAPMLNLTQGTVAVWAKRDLQTGYSYILDCGYTFPATNGWTLGNDNASPTKLYVCGPDSSRNTVLTWNDYQNTNWHHFAFTWSSGNAIGYFDGLPFQTNTLPSLVLSLDDANWLCIGAIQHDTPPGLGTYPNAAFLNGTLTDIRMYNTALSASELLNVYYVSAAPELPHEPATAIPGSLPPQTLMHLTFTNWGGFTNVLDVTTNGCDAIALGTNGPTLTTGPFGTNAAGHFAAGQWLAVLNVFPFEYLSNGFTAMWINYDNAVGSGDYYAMDGWYAFPETNCFTIGAPGSNPTEWRQQINGSVHVDATYPDWAAHGAWHHYGSSWDGTNVTIYFDGNPAGSSVQTSPFFHVEDIAGWMAIGVQHGSHVWTSPSFGWLQGSLADIRVGNYAMTATNMWRLAHWQEPQEGSTPPLPPVASGGTMRVQTMRAGTVRIGP